MTGQVFVLYEEVEGSCWLPRGVFSTMGRAQRAAEDLGASSVERTWRDEPSGWWMVRLESGDRWRGFVIQVVPVDVPVVGELERWVPH